MKMMIKTMGSKTHRVIEDGAWWIFSGMVLVLANIWTIRRSHVGTLNFIILPGLVNIQKTMERSTIFQLGKSTN